MSWSLIWLLSFLKKDGATTGERRIARNIGQKLLDDGLKDDNSDTIPTIMAELKGQYGITTDTYEASGRSGEIGTYHAFLNAQSTPERKKNFTKNWLRRGRSLEGD